MKARQLINIVSPKELADLLRLNVEIHEGIQEKTAMPADTCHDRVGSATDVGRVMLDATSCYGQGQVSGPSDTADASTPFPGGGTHASDSVGRGEATASSLGSSGSALVPSNSNSECPPRHCSCLSGESSMGETF